MMGTTGIRFDATKSERIPEESGKALQQLKSIGELGSFHYTVNLVHALKYTATQFIDLIPKVYDRRRVVTILREDDTEEQATIDPNLAVPFQTKPMQGGPMPKVEKLYNPGLGKYDVAITTGPNFMTKRMESSDSMINFMKTLPNSAQVIAGPVARNQDWPGAEEIADRLDAMLPPQVLQKNMQHLGDLPPQAKAVIGSLTMQVQQMGQQLQQAAKELEDKNKQLALDDKKIDKDFEAKLLKIGADIQMAVEQKLSEELRIRDERMDRGFDAAREDHHREQDRNMQREQAERDARIARSAPAASGA